MQDSGKTYIIRVEGTAYRYGLGEVVSPGVALFNSGFYNLTKEQLNAKLKVTWGLGEPVAEGVLLFREGFYDLDAEQLAAKLKETGKAVLQ
jgi:hypothetical protein